MLSVNDGLRPNLHQAAEKCALARDEIQGRLRSW